MIIEYFPRKRDVPFTKRNINLSFKKNHLKNFFGMLGIYICTISQLFNKETSKYMNAFSLLKVLVSQINHHWLYKKGFWMPISNTDFIGHLGTWARWLFKCEEAKNFWKSGRLYPMTQTF